jgi:hypothetical protein
MPGQPTGTVGGGTRKHVTSATGQTLGAQAKEAEDGLARFTMRQLRCARTLGVNDGDGAAVKGPLHNRHPDAAAVGGVDRGGPPIGKEGANQGTRDVGVGQAIVLVLWV